MPSEQEQRLHELTPALRRLDALIERALRHARAIYGDEPDRGLYISRADIDRILGDLQSSPSTTTNVHNHSTHKRTSPVPVTPSNEGPFWTRWFARRPKEIPADAAESVLDAPFKDVLHPRQLEEIVIRPIPVLDLTGTRLGLLAETYSLDAFDIDVLLVALAPELDLRYERLYAYLQDDVTRKRPTVDLTLNLLCSSAEEKLTQRAHFDPDAPLMQQGMIHLMIDPAMVQPPLLANYIQLDGQFVDILLGQNGLDRRLSTFCELVEPAFNLDDLLLDDDTRHALPAVVAGAIEAQRPLTFYFQGPASNEQRRTAEALAVECKGKLLWVHLPLILTAEIGFTQAVKLLLREARFQGAVLFLDDLDPLRGAEAGLFYQQLMEALADYNGITILTGAQPWAPLTRGPVGTIVLSFSFPGFDQRRASWQYQLENADVQLADDDLDSLASRFHLTQSQIANAVASAVNMHLWSGAGGEKDTQDYQLNLMELFAACRQQSGYDLAALTHKVQSIFAWKDIVLPEDAMTQLHEICEQVAHREFVLEVWGFNRKLSQGKGVSALFSGPPGTGKTMAAEVIANQLGMDLYKIDLSSVVSKYIGETEQNLERIFKTAENANAILFFDEADVLFSKRSEVRDAHDRYANIEVAYLLQRMEQYEGLAILATNLRQNMDEAFTRRLQFIVDFPFPDEGNRLRIWQIQFPKEAPLDPVVDFALLARQFRIAGGSIKNIALSAAYLAAAEGHKPIGMDHLVRASQREFQKIGKIAPELGVSANPEKADRLA